MIFHVNKNTYNFTGGAGFIWSLFAVDLSKEKT
jgi:hypothetical protein